MALRGKKPEAIQKRLKLLMYGPPGIGKTTASIQFPAPYLIDTERGAENEQYVKMLSESGGAYFFTTSPDELIEEVTQLLSTKHPYKTLVIDPLTTIYNDLLDKGAAELGTDFGRHKGPADRKTKHLLNLLTRLDMNVIITSHAKTKYVRAKDARGKDTIVDDGQTFDCYGKLDYLFDLSLELGKRGNERGCTVRKTRLEGFPEGETFPFSYAEIARRYGGALLEQEARPVELATPEQAKELERLVAAIGVPSETVAKWLEKAGAETFSEMPAESIGKCIEWAARQEKGVAV